MRPILVLVAAGLLVSVACATNQASSLSNTTDRAPVSTRNTLPVIRTAPPMELTSHSGTRVKLSDFKGKVVLVNFFYTSCSQGVCALQNSGFKAVRASLDAASRERVVLLSITFDPEVDTPRILAKYAQERGFSQPGWLFLTGTPDEIKQVTGEYGILYQLVPAEKHVHPGGEAHEHERAFEHLSQALVIDQQGLVRKQLLGVQAEGQVFPVEELVQDVKSLLLAP